MLESEYLCFYSRNDSVIFRDESSVFVLINNWQQFVSAWYLEFVVLFCSSLCQCELWETDVKQEGGVGVVFM